MIKNYMLDTSVLLDNPNNIFGFADNNVFICGTTLQELDKKKTMRGDVGYNARECCRILDDLRKQGDLRNGVKLKNGGTLYIEPNGIDASLLPKGYSIDVPDNRIISSGLWLKNVQGRNTILLTNDVSMRVNATICGLETQEVKNDTINTSNYTGHRDLDTTTDIINQLYKKGTVSIDDIRKEHAEFNRSIEKCDAFFTKLFEDFDQILTNEFVTLHVGNQSALSICRNGNLVRINSKSLNNGVSPLNKMQTYALWALTAPVEEIPLVILQGPAGCAKTFLSLAAGLSQVYLGQGKKDVSEYSRIMISRPNTTAADPGFGFLPGDLSDKMEPLIASYRDNLEEIVGLKEDDKEAIKMMVEDYFESGTIELCPLNFIRGRSIHNTYLICDEAQNANKLLIRDVITRAGRKSKFVIAGDPTQCDVATLDAHNNGLVYAIDSLKDSDKVAIITFDSEQCVRSELAELAIERMKKAQD